MKTQITQKIRFSVSGMSCGGCVKSVEDALADVPGVQQARVRVGAVEVVIDPKRISAAELEALLRTNGFAPERQEGKENVSRCCCSGSPTQDESMRRQIAEL